MAENETRYPANQGSKGLADPMMGHIYNFKTTHLTNPTEVVKADS